MNIQNLLAILVIFFSGMPGFAAAQEAPPVAPASGAAAVPATPATVAATAAPSGNFPALPPSRSCSKGELVGVWKLMRVHEEPAGTETSVFAVEPVQYMMFEKGNTFKEYRSARKELSDDSVARRLASQKSADLQQFVVDTSGIVFFYKNGVATDGLACFIVANPKGSFTVGQMLLMPPAPAEGTPDVRMVKIYQKTWSAPSKKEKKKGAKAKDKGKNKENNKGRKGKRKKK